MWTIIFEHHPIVPCLNSLFGGSVKIMLIVEVLLVDQLDEMLVPASSLTHGTIKKDG